MNKYAALFVLTALSACAQLPVLPTVPSQSVSVPSDPGKVVDGPGALTHLTADQSATLRAEVAAHMTQFEKASKDFARFCPKYVALASSARVEAWSTMVASVIRYESDLDAVGMVKTCTSFKEPTGVDSIGLLQLSYGDSYPNCPKSKAEASLCDVGVNLKCGVGAMAQLIERDGVVTGGGYIKRGYPSGAAGAGRYWSVLREPDLLAQIIDGKSYKSDHKLKEIMALTAAAPGCQ